MALHPFRAVCLSLLALLASSCSEVCEGWRCDVPPSNPCGADPDCGWRGLFVEPVAVPTPPRAGRLITLDGKAQPGAFALKTAKDRIYTFTCVAEDFDACQVTLQATLGGVSPFVEQEGRTTRVHFRPLDGAGAAVFVTGLPEGSTGAFQYALAEREDDHGLTAAEATRLIPGEAPVPGILQAGPDTDTFVFDVPQGRIFDLACLGPFPSGTSSGITGPDGNTLLAGEEFDLLGKGRGRRFMAPIAGRHVLTLDGTLTPADVPYTCAVRDLGQDDHGDLLATATVLPEAESMPIQGTLETSHDRDVFTFLARAGHAYSLTCDTTNFVPCIEARVYSPRNEQLSLTFPVGVASDTWLMVRVEGRNAHRGAYSLTLRDLGADQGSGPQDAVRILGDVPLTGYLTPLGDEDFFRFDAVAGHVYRLTVEDASAEAVLFDSPGTHLTRFDLTGAPYFLVDANAAVLLRVWGPQAKYRLSVRDVGMDDHAGTAADATDVGAALSVAGVLNSSTDVDWFAVRLEARPYATAVTSVDTKFVLFEADGVTPVPWDTDSSTWRPRAAGRHLLRADMFGRFMNPDAYRVELLPR
jgi:hypothetical protein